MTSRDLGLFLARGAVGGAISVHGMQKLFGLFGGGGIDATASSFDQMGFRPARPSAIASAAAEGIGGSLLALGAATPLAAAAVAANMSVAASVHRPKGFFVTEGGLEYPLVLGTVATALAFTGPGDFSVDRLFRHRFSKTWMGVGALVGTLSTAATVIWSREHRLEVAPSRPAEDETGGDAAAPGVPIDEVA